MPFFFGKRVIASSLLPVVEFLIIENLGGYLLLEDGTELILG